VGHNSHHKREECIYFGRKKTLNGRGEIGNARFDRRRVLRVWTDFIGLEKCPVVGSCEHGNELSGSINGGNDLASISKRTLRDPRR
jgi:hypothetical protein